MKKSKFSETQIVSILKQGDAGVPVKDLCRQAGISSATYYQWKSRYGGMEASDLRRVLGLELLQALGVLGFHAAVLGSPGVEAGRAEAVLSAQLRYRHAGFGLLEKANDLFRGEATLAHVRPLLVTDST